MPPVDSRTCGHELRASVVYISRGSGIFGSLRIRCSGCSCHGSGQFLHVIFRIASSANDSTILANARNDSQDICMAIGKQMRFSPAKRTKCSLVAGLSSRLLLSLGYAGRTSTVSLAIPINILKNDPNNSLDEILQFRPLSPNASAHKETRTQIYHFRIVS
ncbi:hypothetical protein M405DRAFT_409869 [Rhizopogon salebrosus TDB-379]|nr:hypothetical protein M405DRAFT_409869 [Rhizopogon salebrosus TDB-379]